MKKARERDLIRLEQIALWMILLCKPKKSVRVQRCIDVARQESIPIEADYDLSDDPSLLTSDERKSFKNALNMTPFERSSLPKAAKIILERLNEYELLLSSQGRIKPLYRTLELEHILPHKFLDHSDWNEDDANE
jgi:hypothetical protein